MKKLGELSPLRTHYFNKESILYNLINFMFCHMLYFFYISPYCSHKRKSLLIFRGQREGPSFHDSARKAGEFLVSLTSLLSWSWHQGWRTWRSRVLGEGCLLLPILPGRGSNLFGILESGKLVYLHTFLNGKNICNSSETFDSKDRQSLVIKFYRAKKELEMFFEKYQ